METTSYSKKVIDTTTVFVAFGFFTFVVSSSFLLFQTLSYLEEQKVGQSPSTENRVLGEKTFQCMDETSLFSKLKQSAPKVIVSAGGQVQEVETENFLPCIDVSEEIGDQCPQLQAGINTACVYTYVSTHMRFLEQKEVIVGSGGKSVNVLKHDWTVNKPMLAQLIIDEYSKRLSEIILHPDAIIRSKNIVLQAPLLTSEPSTDGTAAKKYIEVDGSRQLMFLWTNGNYQTLQVSGAIPGYNPVGVFTVLNKAKLAWSSTASKWMPYWMAFTFDKKQDAMLGIHSLVYWFPGYQPKGDKVIREPESNVGIPRSTGCIRLKESDALMVYNWASVGDLVVIHE